MAVRSLARWARSIGRRLTPPGNRTPLEESLEQRPGLSSNSQPPRPPGDPGPPAAGSARIYDGP